MGTLPAIAEAQRPFHLHCGVNRQAALSHPLLNRPIDHSRSSAMPIEHRNLTVSQGAVPIDCGILALVHMVCGSR